jgi:hypothetical protein
MGLGGIGGRVASRISDAEFTSAAESVRQPDSSVFHGPPTLIRR